VQEPVPVRIVERISDRCAQRKYVGHRQRTCFEARLERAAGDVFHDQELAAASRIEVKDGGDTRMGQARKYERLTSKALTRRRVTQSSVQEHLDRDIPIQVVVVCFPHFPHPALANALEEPVPAKDGTGFDGYGPGGGVSNAGCHEMRFGEEAGNW
jgi:hypothetical protein